jgi:nucleoside-diphosphate kinase
VRLRAKTNYRKIISEHRRVVIWPHSLKGSASVAGATLRRWVGPFPASNRADGGAACRDHVLSSAAWLAIDPHTSRQAKEDFDMAVERTFSMIKPDATRRNLTGAINAKLEAAGLRIVAQKRVWMSRAQAEGFYAVHRARPFYDELCAFMSSGPTVVQVLEGEDAIRKNRDVMGATDPSKAAQGTIRKEFANSIGENSVHGSDAADTARQEIGYWFAEVEIVG